MFSVKNDDPGKNYGFDSYDKERLENMINSYDKEMLKMLTNLYSAVNNEKLDLTGVTGAVDALVKYNSKSEYNYLNNLLSPEKCKGVKIPSPIPVPSCSFQLHNCVTLSPNIHGTLGVLFNPYYLGSKDWIDNGNGYYSRSGAYFPANSNYVLPENALVYSPLMVSSLMVNNDVSLNGTEPNNHWRPININQVIPPVYDQYRLVSASVVVKYIGRLDIVSGVIGGAIVFDEIPYLNGKVNIKTADVTQNVELTNPSIAKYGNFDLAMDSYYHQENLVLEGLRQLYFPLDNSYEEYAKLLNQDNIENISKISDNEFTIELNTDNYKSGFNFFIYTLNAPTGSCLKFDIYCNFECLPTAEFLNYMPISVSTYGISNQDKKEALNIVQEKPIMKANETIEVQSPSSMGWKNYMKNMAKRFKDTLPGLSKLGKLGIEYLVPKLKPAIAIAGTLINSVAQSGQDKNMNIDDVE